jgi:hypothetical protein
VPPQSCRCHRKPAVFGRQPPFSEQQAKRRPPCLCTFVPFCGCLSPTPQCWKRLMRAADRMVYCHPRCEARLCGRPAHTGIPTTNNEDGVDLRMFFHSSPQHDQTPCLPAHTHTEHVGRTAVAAEFENPTLWQNVPPLCPCAIVPQTWSMLVWSGYAPGIQASRIGLSPRYPCRWLTLHLLHLSCKCPHMLAAAFPLAAGHSASTLRIISSRRENNTSWLRCSNVAEDAATGPLRASC